MESTDKTFENEEQAGCQTGVCQTETPAEKAGAADADGRPVYVPAVDVIEGEGEVTLIADVPGVTESGIELTVEKSVLTLIAKPVEQSFEGKRLAYSEYGVGEYRCSFALSDEIDKDRITAAIKDGVLRMTLPKSAPVMRKITVAAS